MNTSPTEPAITYSRHAHAAHYAYGHPAVGHDLEQWRYAQPERLPRPAGVPADAKYHSGSVIAGVQFWLYVRIAPLSAGVCGRCPKSRQRCEDRPSAGADRSSSS